LTTFLILFQGSNKRKGGKEEADVYGTNMKKGKRKPNDEDDYIDV